VPIPANPMRAHFTCSGVMQKPTCSYVACTHTTFDLAIRLDVFLARTGKTVHELNFVSLYEQGSLQIVDQRATSTRSAAPGVKIVFSDGAGPK
jgi:hypothetical protein